MQIRSTILWDPPRSEFLSRTILYTSMLVGAGFCCLQRKAYRHDWAASRHEASRRLGPRWCYHFAKCAQSQNYVTLAKSPWWYPARTQSIVPSPQRVTIQCHWVGLFEELQYRGETKFPAKRHSCLDALQASHGWFHTDDPLICSPMLSPSVIYITVSAIYELKEYLKKRKWYQYACTRNSWLKENSVLVA